MILSFLRKDPVREAAQALFAAAVEQSRAPVFYTDYGIEDSPEGRFEILAVHVYLLLRRLKGEGEAADRLGQKLFDVFFASLDDSLRELGVGDLAVGKRIRKMAEAFYGRVGAYEAALEAEEPADLKSALARNIYGDPDAPLSKPLAVYVRAAAAAIDAQPSRRLAGGVAWFPPAAPVTTEAALS